MSITKKAIARRTVLRGSLALPLLGGTVPVVARAAAPDAAQTPGSSPFDKRGLHNRINRVSHFDVNVSDLERSRVFYEKTASLEVFARTESPRQRFGTLGLQNGQFKGYMLRDKDSNPYEPAHWAIHLVQWLEPKPVGTPYISHANVGWYRIVPMRFDIVDARRRVVAAGGKPFAPTTFTMIQLGGPSGTPISYQVFAAHDPDGTTLEWAQVPGSRDGLNTVASNTTNAARHLSFYTDVLGLDFKGGLQTPKPVPNVYDPLGGMTGHVGGGLIIRGHDRFSFDWLEWTESARYPTPYQEPHHLGIVRCAIEVDDLDAAYETLLATQWENKPISVSGPPEVWDYGPEFGAHKVVSFTDPEGVGFQLIQQPPYRGKTVRPWG